MTSLRGEKRTEFPQSVRKKIFARACQRCDVEGVENLPGRPQCENCGKEVRSGGFIYEHVQPDGLGGEPTLENGKLHCVSCADVKTRTQDNPRMRKADAVLKKNFGLQPTKRQPMQGRGFATVKPQRRASSPVNKWKGF